MKLNFEKLALNSINQSTLRIAMRRAEARVKTTAVTLRSFPVAWAVVLAGATVFALFAEHLAPYPYYQISDHRLLAPSFWMPGGSTQFLLGTDALGRDILSRLIFGARISLIVTICGVILSGVIGVTLGISAAYYGGWLRALLMRLADIILSLPAVLIALLFAVIHGASLINVVIIVTLVYWGRYARLVQGEALSLKERDFVAYARLIGVPNVMIMLRHIFPNLLPSVLVLSSYLAAGVIILEASLSFLGAGVPPPQPSWGAMISDGKDYIASAWWVSTFPGLAIVMLCLAFNQVGDWLRDHLDPKLRQL